MNTANFGVLDIAAENKKSSGEFAPQLVEQVEQLSIQEPPKLSIPVPTPTTTKTPAPVKSTTGSKFASSCDQESLREWKSHAQDGVYVLPCYYPRNEKRSAMSNQALDILLDRLFLCFKKLNIQAHLDSSFATFGFSLRTADQLELSLLIWYTNKKRTSVYLEVDKRQAGRGCSSPCTPLKYICRILKAVKCNSLSELTDESMCLPEHRELQKGNAGFSDRCQRWAKVEVILGPSTPPAAAPSPAPSKSSSSTYPLYGVQDQAMSSLQMVWGLMGAPVTWSQGLELLSSISNPDMSGVESSLAVSKVILLGKAPVAYGATYCREIHEKLVGLTQSLAGDSQDEKTDHLSAYQKDCLLQLALTCLVNAMELSASSAEASMDICMGSATPANGARSLIMSQFIESTKGMVACDILDTLMTIVGHANTKPHHAYLAVKALFLLSSEDSAIRQCVYLAMSDDADEKVLRAQEVGTRSHGLLEAECERLRQIVLESRQ